MDGGTPFLPQEIITIILKRLPVRPLLRFQCICKLWKTIIKSPSFIEDHLHHSSNQSPFLLCPGDQVANPLPLYLLDCETRNFELAIAAESGWLTMIGSSNGLLCFKNFHVSSPPSIWLCNLATRKTRLVASAGNEFKASFLKLLGFGFSPMVNDYKIVIIHISISDKVIGVEVYSLGSGLWRKVEFENLPKVSRVNMVAANGVMYWLGKDPDLILSIDPDMILPFDPNIIISFDPVMEVFALIPMPPLYPTLSCKLTVFENKLAMLSLPSTFVIELWVIDEYTGSSLRDKWNWTRKYTIGPFASVLYPMTVWRNEIVCHGTLKTGPEAEHGEPTNILYLFNPTSAEYRTVTTNKWFGDAFNFRESLLPLSSNHIDEP